MRYLSIIFILLGACSALEGGGDLSRQRVSSACAAGLEQVFSEQYHPFLVTNCSSCHQAGGSGKGGFADQDLAVAFNQFQLRGSVLIAERAVDFNHQPPATGPHLQTDIDNIEPLWQAALVEAATCNAAGDNSPPVGDPLPSSGNFITTSKTMNGTENLQNLSWDLASEIVTPVGASLSGATFSIDLRTSITATGATAYEFSNPQLTAGSESIRVALVEIQINDVFISSATTYRGIDRYVADGTTVDLSLTTMVVPTVINANDSLAITFGILETVEFNPTTFTELTQAGGIFANNCVGCHSAANAQGGLDITNFNGLISQFLVVPFNPNSSEIYKRMSDPVNPMPPAGLLLEAEQDRVRDWLLDGAPQN